MRALGFFDIENQVWIVSFFPDGQEEGASLSIAIRKEDLGKPQVMAFIEILKCEEFHKRLDEMGGYGYHQAGKIIQI